MGLASDHFTLGVIGYQLLTGALPFSAATPDQLLGAIANGTPTPVSERLGADVVPEKLLATVNRCLEKDPKARFSDLRALATDLAAVIKTTPPDPAPKPRKRVFGAGLDLSTRMAETTALEDEPDDSVDDDRTRIGPSETMERVLSELDVPTAAKVSDSLPVIPKPLTVTGDVEADDLAAALADASASLEVTPQPAPRQGRPSPRVAAELPTDDRSAAGLDDDLASALAAAAGEVGAPMPGTGGSDGDFDPFGDAGGATAASSPLAPTPSAPTPPNGMNAVSEDEVEAEAEAEAEAEVSAPSARKPRTSVPPSEMSSAILEALDEEVGGGGGSAGASSPLATAADFAALSPLALDQALPTGSGNGVPRSTTTPPTSGSGDGLSVGVLALLLLLLAGGGGGAWWFLTQQGKDTAHQRPKVANPAPEVEAVVPPQVATKAILDSTPKGATVYLGAKELGVTPLEVELSGPDALAYDLKLEGHQDATQEINPKTLGEGPEPQRFVVNLSPTGQPKAATPSAERPAPPSEKKTVAISQTGKPGAAPTPAVAKPASAAAAPKPRKVKRRKRKKPRKKRKKSDIKDPFAD